jgi:hypothetical protein
MMKLNRAIWAIAAFLVIGYVPTLYVKAPTISIALAACAIIPLGSAARSLPRALARGIGLGAVAGMAIAMALIEVLLTEASQKEQTAPRFLMLFTTTTAAMCGLVSAIFWYVAKRRRQRIEDQWQR